MSFLKPILIIKRAYLSYNLGSADVKIFIVGKIIDLVEDLD